MSKLSKRHRGYPLKAGQCMIATPSLPRSWQSRNVGEDGRKEVGNPPTEKAGGGRRAICSATIEVMQRCPPLGSLWWQAALVRMPVRERAMAALDGGRGPLRGTHTLGGLRLPLLKGLEGQPLGEHVVRKRRLARLQGFAQLGFSPGTACMGHVVGPRDAWEAALLGPCSPARRAPCVLHILFHPCPPEVPSRRQGGQWLPDLGARSVAGWALMTGRQRVNGLDLRVQLARALGGRLRGGVGTVEGRAGA
jgi:hypothetical protein